MDALRPEAPGAPLWTEGDPPVGLYIHVPFCRALCTYCAFAKGLYDEAAAGAWLDALAAEIASRERTTWRGRPALDSVFLGGGTPSTLPPTLWERLGSLVAKRFRLLPGAEFTAEANPESFEPRVARAMRAAGVNRVSFGSQSFDPAELALLGRIHDASGPGRAVETARREGFDNLSLDLMYGLPGQTAEGFGRSLDAAFGLAPDHLSAYCLALEPGTPLAAAVGRGDIRRPDEDHAAVLYEILVERATGAGFTHYEISNFARPGRESRHNLRYWRRRDVIGLGPSAHALLGGRRWANPAPLEAWTRAYADPGLPPEPRPVPEADARFEWIFLHLRLSRGLSLDDYARHWGESIRARHGGAIARLTELDLLETREGHLRLTPRARFLSDAVFAEFAP